MRGKTCFDSKIILLQLEVIGGAETYMAACRRCFHSCSSVPASPRLPLTEMEAESNNSGDVGAGGDPGTNKADQEEPPVKKALFDDKEEAKENEGMVVN